MLGVLADRYGGREGLGGRGLGIRHLGEHEARSSLSLRDGVGGIIRKPI